MERGFDLVRGHDCSSGEECAERARFADAVTQAVADMCARSREYQAARDWKENPEQISINMAAAHSVERAAVYAYDEHIKMHGCKP
jgi:hypothetical protein